MTTGRLRDHHPSPPLPPPSPACAPKPAPVALGAPRSKWRRGLSSHFRHDAKLARDSTEVNIAARVCVPSPASTWPPTPTRCNFRLPWPSHRCAPCSDQGSEMLAEMPTLPCTLMAHPIHGSAQVREPFPHAHASRQARCPRPVCINLGLDLRLPRTLPFQCSSQHRHPGPLAGCRPSFAMYINL